MGSTARRAARVRPRAGARVLVSGLGVVALTAGCGLLGSDDRSEQLDVLEVRERDCLLAPEGTPSEIVTVRRVDCDEPHQHEVYAIVPFIGTDGTPPQDYPGEAALTTFAEARCLEAFEDYVGVDYRDSSLYFTWLLPSARGWQGAGSTRDRDVVCLITTTGEPRTGSVKNPGL